MYRFSSRRETLITSAAATFAATGLSTPGVVFAQTVGGGTTQTPGVTEGPYWVDGQPERSDLRTNTTAPAVVFAGLPLQLSVTVARLAGTAVSPVSGAKVDLWAASAAGKYSAVASEGTTGQNFLRGYQTTSSRGLAKFTTIYPGWYSGRTTHEHFRVRVGAVNFVSQFFFDDAVTDAVYAARAAVYNGSRGARTVRNTTDMVYTGASQGTGRSVSNNAGTYLMLRLAADGSKAIASFNVVIV